ncbi:sensor histidine kinase [Paracoccus aminophilus]|uniref:histidine kinase n=1 Tax=Paracoccus aminophilus JCM 7686 TaxID=1367847 RepID=S5YIQ3_PARAH|nr:ATP-binding protein [Paracoccus aminophilus]AGT11353.1 sensor histidine kinase [Paracoccus aminophilus JCM 7686]
MRRPRAQIHLGRHPQLTLGLLSAAMAVIFLADTLTDYAIAAAVFYTAVILAAARLLPARRVVWLASICVALTLLSFAMTHSGGYEVGLINTAISMIAIAITAWLALRLVEAEAAAHATRERLLRMARVTSLGELTASIAHEVNQPLAAVVTSAGACRRWLAQEPPVLDKAAAALDRIEREATRASAVIARVRGFASGKPPERAAFALQPLVLDIAEMARDQIDRAGISLTLFLPESLPEVHADRLQIGQVVTNLLLNAIEALRAPEISPREIEISAEAIGDEVRVRVQDSGPGFSETEAAQLFDAFWTTKPDGIGLGLTICRSIVEANGGRIRASALPGGAALEFTLPTTGHAP